MTQAQHTAANKNNIDVNLEFGFAHIITSDNLTIQCCLEMRKDGNGFKKSIDTQDCGELDGICGDVNQAAFEKYGIAESMRRLFKEMRKEGVKIK